MNKLIAALIIAILLVYGLIVSGKKISDLSPASEATKPKPRKLTEREQRESLDPERRRAKG